MKILVNVDNLKDGKVIRLLEEHLKEMQRYSPPESIHALDKSKFNDSSLVFWSASFGESLVGCGALKQLSQEHGEIKSMRTSKEFLRKGIAQNILNTILDEASSRKYHRLSLETGTHDAFLPAIKLYKKCGFHECEPFGDYEVDPHSVFLTKELNNA